MEQSAQFFFSPENRVAPLGIVAMEGAQELADKIEATWYGGQTRRG